MITLYLIYNVTTQEQAHNPNRNNGLYTKLSYAKKGLRAFQFRYPDQQFEIHEYTYIKSRVIHD